MIADLILMANENKIDKEHDVLQKRLSARNIELRIRNVLQRSIKYASAAIGCDHGSAK